MVIYKVTNNINNKMYIGQTVYTLKERMYGHKSRIKSGSKLCFHNAIRKYGLSNFEWEVLYECDNKEELDKMEIYYIGYYDTYNNGYNCTLGGEKGTTGYKHSKEIIKIIGDSQRGAKHSRARPVSIEGQCFVTIREASNILDIPWTTIWNRIRRPNCDYRYIEKGKEVPEYVCTR